MPCKAEKGNRECKSKAIQSQALRLKMQQIQLLKRTYTLSFPSTGSSARFAPTPRPYRCREATAQKPCTKQKVWLKAKTSLSGRGRLRLHRPGNTCYDDTNSSYIHLVLLVANYLTFKVICMISSVRTWMPQ